MKNLLTLLLLLVSFSSFAQVKMKDPFIGMDKKALIKEYGQPTSTKPDGKGGEVVTFKQEKVWADENTTQIRYQTISFSLNKEGKVYEWREVPPARANTEIIAN